MSQIYFKPIEIAPAYSISKKGEVQNIKTGFPIKVENGKVRLNIDGNRNFYSVEKLVLDTWGISLKQEEVSSALDADIPAAPAEFVETLDTQKLDEIIHQNQKNAVKKPSRASKKEKKAPAIKKEKALSRSQQMYLEYNAGKTLLEMATAHPEWNKGHIANAIFHCKKNPDSVKKALELENPRSLKAFIAL